MCSRGGWVNLKCTNLQFKEQGNNKLACKSSFCCRLLAQQTRQNIHTHNTPQNPEIEMQWSQSQTRHQRLDEEKQQRINDHQGHQPQ